MDSPPSYSLSITSCGPLSDIGSSGIGGSISSDSVRAHFAGAEMQESDMEGKSLSQDSLACCSDGGMCGEHFNTLKKGPMWSDVLSAAAAVVSAAVGDVTIKPPPEFQDSPSPGNSADYATAAYGGQDYEGRRMAVWSPDVYEYAESFVELLISEALASASKLWLERKRLESKATKEEEQSMGDKVTKMVQTETNSIRRVKNSARFWMSDFVSASSGTSATYQTPASIITPFSTLKRPNSRSSLASLTRLSSSHNSLNTIGSGGGTGNNKVDDSSFITLAMSHDVLNTNQIIDMYNVPFDSDIYTVPIDFIRPFQHEFVRTAPQRPKRHKHHRHRRRNTSVTSGSATCQVNYLDVRQPFVRHLHRPAAQIHINQAHTIKCTGNCAGQGKRHSVPGTSLAGTVRSVQQYNPPSKTRNPGEPAHMTLHEVRQYLRTLYSPGPRKQASEDGKFKQRLAIPKVIVLNNNNNKYNNDSSLVNTSLSNGHILNNNNSSSINNNCNANGKKQSRKSRDSVDSTLDCSANGSGKAHKKTQRNFSLSIKQTLCNIFRFSSKRGSLVVNHQDSPEYYAKRNGHHRNDHHHHHHHSNEIVLHREGNNDHPDSLENNTDYYHHQQQQHANNNNCDLDCVSANNNGGAAVVTASTNTMSAKLPSILKRALPPLPKSSASASGNNNNGAGEAKQPAESTGSLGESIIKSIFSSNADKQQQAVKAGNVVIQDKGGTSSDGDEGAVAGCEDNNMDFAASIEKVKDYGWYWGPISGEAAEKILSNEPDGSFIVRDSSDDHYIFSLSFRLNGCVRHVRIEHDQGNFSFGSCTKFKSHTIVDFIENAVEHSRSGRYLFFLHRRPVLGPMRVQLLHPVSRFKQVQSLQHICRFVILKMVRKDLIPTLPLPRRLIDYLSAPQYYSEQLDNDESLMEQERVESPVSSSTGELEKICFTPQNGLS